MHDRVTSQAPGHALLLGRFFAAVTGVVSAVDAVDTAR